MPTTIEYEVSREANITATEREFNSAASGTPIIVGHDASHDEPKITRSLFQDGQLSAVRADFDDGRSYLVLLRADAAHTDEQAHAFAGAALKSAGIS